jgi:hypothetical protein
MVAHALVFGPFSKRLPNSIHSNESGTASISYLLSASRPSAIFGSIVSFMVNSIDRVFLAWSSSHVFKKQKETILPRPSWGYYNSFSSVKDIVGCVLVRTPRLYLTPTGVFWGVCEAMNRGSWHKSLIKNQQHHYINIL